MTIKDELHALVDRLPEPEAHEALDYLRARIERASQPGYAFVNDSLRALDEGLAPDAIRVPHSAVRGWLQAWGTRDEEAADATLPPLADRPNQGTRRAG
jgi:hypothetical protein